MFLLTAFISATAIVPLFGEHQFKVSIIPPVGEVANLLPLPVRFGIKYLGPSERVGVDTLDPPYVVFEGVEKWVPKGEEDSVRVQFAHAPQILKKGQELSRVWYLHDFFEYIPPGDSEVTCHFTFLAVEGEKSTPVSRTSSFRLKLFQPEQRIVEEHLRGILSVARQSKSQYELVETVRSVLSIDHPVLLDELSQVLLERYDDVNAWTHMINKKLLPLALKSNSWNQMMAYLSRRGSPSDEFIFRYMKENGVRLPLEQKKRLLSCESLWIRAYAIQYLEKEKSLDEWYEFTRQEINDLVERTK
ncbi:MAG: hypothetical protein O3B01_15750 [Planctomycetota bacterium]|nr:hypothetical protein [Planctomycetota bacterium]